MSTNQSSYSPTAIDRPGMESPGQEAPPSPWTTGKIALVATLSLVLVVVLVVQFGGEQEAGPSISLATPQQSAGKSVAQPTLAARRSASSPASQPAPAAAPAMTTPTASSGRSSKSSHNWPVIPRTTVQRFNPFRVNRFSGDEFDDEGNPVGSSAQPGEISQHESGERGERSGSEKSERESRRRIAEVERERAERIDAYRRERQRELDEILAWRVGLLLLKPQGNRAVVDHRVVRTGDVIDGFVITDITPKGVEFVDQQTEPE